MTADDFAYTGTDNLEVMTEAVNYNRYLLDCVEREISAPGQSVLDFGAGSGTYADMLAERGITPDCLEPDGDLQTVLRGKGYPVVDLSDVADKADSYDVIYTLNVFEHIKNDQDAADDLATLLKPGGRIVVYVPAMESLFTSMDVKVEHYRRYRRAQLTRILKNSGLRIVSSQYCDPIGFFATLVYRFAGRSDGTINPRALKTYDRFIFPLSRLLQGVTGRLFGKNVLVVATKDQ